MHESRSGRRSAAGRGGHVAGPSMRVAKLLGILLVPAAVVATGLTVAASSYSAFTAQTSVGTNSFNTGTVVLANDAGSALFSLTNLKPALATVQCITVTSTGTLPSTIKMYPTPSSLVDANSLAPYIDMKIEQGTGGSFGSCGAFSPTSVLANNVPLSSLVSSTTGFGNGLGSWVQSSGGTDSRTYRFTTTLDSAVTNALQGKTAQVGFTWEAQNN